MPTRAAIISAVSPVGSAAFGSAPASSSSRIIAALPFEQARNNGVTPYRLASFGSAPAASNSSRRRQVVAPHGPVQRGRAVLAGRVDVDLLPEQRAHGGRVPLHRRVGEPRVARGKGVDTGRGSEAASTSANIFERAYFHGCKHPCIVDGCYRCPGTHAVK